ncbi:SDR family oxidoreductase [Streptomyces rubradiris]|uniref:NADP-dependent 3-hydroxy acid dehydrogenase YdfG n=1 Tax=Streptomyces rubradiris TaxID=285531 RepID=A0ABQ3RAR5_STRRR|nr:SDR family oxidoreductase [Streptomyces rubradiris]GHH18760.1 hypothetical protein GCM10018792_50830 [Streptomyces rubradiris]GHI52949.1 hypothetical protein Srubr_27950 [Streptomyces rubradiris]
MDWPAGEAAFVTGAASGIGLGNARALVVAGAKVAPADVDEGRLAEAAKELTDAGGTVTAVRLDVSDEKNRPTAADRVEEALGPISLLCNVAGVNGGGPIEETPLKIWRWVLGVNVDGQFIGASTFLPRFRSRGTRAHILNTASVSGLVPTANVGACTASKFAGVGFTMVLREELRDSDVGVSLLVPGTVATRLDLTAGEAEAKCSDGSRTVRSPRPTTRYSPRAPIPTESANRSSKPSETVGSSSSPTVSGGPWSAVRTPRPRMPTRRSTDATARIRPLGCRPGARTR